MNKRNEKSVPADKVNKVSEVISGNKSSANSATKNSVPANLRKIVSAAGVFLLCAVFAVLSFVNLGSSSLPSSFYRVSKWDETASFEAVVFKLDKLPDEIWMYLSGRDYTEEKDSITVYTSSATSLTGSFSSSYGLGSTTISNSDSNVGNWYKLAKFTSTSSTRLYFQFSASDKIRIGELIFLDAEHKAIAAVVSDAGTVSSYTGAHSDKDLGNADKVKEAAKLLDEQNKFDYSAVSDGAYRLNAREKIYESEAKTFESVANLLSGDGYFIDKTVNPLGLQIISAGAAVFGLNTFGVRFASALFSLGLIVAAYFFGKILFKNPLFGLFFAFLVFTDGLVLTYATAASVNPIFTVFTVLSYLFMTLFYQRGISKAHRFRSLLNLLLSALFFALSFGVRIQACFSFAGLAGIFALGLVRQFRAYKFRESKLAEEGLFTMLKSNKSEYRYKLSSSLASFLGGAVAFTALVSFLSYLGAYNVFSGIYPAADGKIFSYISANMQGMFSAVNATSYSAINSTNMFAVLVNAAREVVSSYKSAFIPIVTVAASLVSMLFFLSYRISMFVMATEEEKKSEFKDKIIFPFYVLGLGFLTNWIALAFAPSVNAGDFYTASIFFVGFTVLAFALFFVKKRKALFTVKNFGVNTGVIALGAFVAAAAAVFALAVPAFVGLNADASLYMWNIIG